MIYKSRQIFLYIHEKSLYNNHFAFFFVPLTFKLNITVTNEYFYKKQY